MVSKNASPSANGPAADSRQRISAIRYASAIIHASADSASAGVPNGASFSSAQRSPMAAVWTSAPAPDLLRSRAISLHITATLAAIGVFALAFCCAALYLVTHHILKQKHGLVWLKRLPPLMTVENAAFSLVAFGFPLLTLGILAGFARFFAGEPLPAGWWSDPHSLLAFVVWGVYGLYLLVRLVANWPPVRTAYVLLVGLALCLLLFLAPSATHRFG